MAKIKDIMRQDIIGCLRVTRPGEEAVRSLRRFRSRDWERSLDWLHRSGLALALWDRLQKLGAEDAIPNAVGAGLERCLAEHRLRVAAMREEFYSLNRHLESAGIEYAAWKGFSLVPDYICDACLRPMYDYDYLISAESWADAQAVLQAAGYARRAQPGTEFHVNFVPPHPHAQPRLAVASLYSAELPRRVELHLRARDEEALGIPLNVPQWPLHRRVRRSWQGVSFYALHELDAFVFQALHAFNHILHNWCRLGWFLEIARFLESRSADGRFWEQLLALLEGELPLMKAVGVVVLLASRLFHATLAAPLAARLADATHGRVALWVEHYGLRSALDNFSANKYALFLHREFVPDEAAWRAIQRDRLFPLHLPNRVTGSVATAAPALLPESCRQSWYAVRRVVHHATNGARYARESARWNRLLRLTADQGSL